MSKTTMSKKSGSSWKLMSFLLQYVDSFVPIVWEVYAYLSRIRLFVLIDASSTCSAASSAFRSATSVGRHCNNLYNLLGVKPLDSFFISEYPGGGGLSGEAPPGTFYSQVLSGPSLQIETRFWYGYHHRSELFPRSRCFHHWTALNPYGILLFGAMRTCQIRIALHKTNH